MWQNSENEKFVSSSQQLLKWIEPGLFRDHQYIDGHESKPANSNFSNFFYLINSKVIPFYIMC